MNAIDGKPAADDPRIALAGIARKNGKTELKRAWFDEPAVQAWQGDVRPGDMPHEMHLPDWWVLLASGAGSVALVAFGYWLGQA